MIQEPLEAPTSWAELDLSDWFQHSDIVARRHWFKYVIKDWNRLTEKGSVSLGKQETKKSRIVV